MLGRSWKYSATSPFPGDGFVISQRIKSEDRKFESVLPFRLAVASRSIAAKLGKDRNDVVFEVERSLLVCGFGVRTVQSWFRRQSAIGQLQLGNGQQETRDARNQQAIQELVNCGHSLTAARQELPTMDACGSGLVGPLSGWNVRRENDRWGKRSGV